MKHFSFLSKVMLSGMLVSSFMPYSFGMKKFKLLTQVPKIFLSQKRPSYNKFNPNPISIFRFNPNTKQLVYSNGKELVCLDENSKVLKKIEYYREIKGISPDENDPKILYVANNNGAVNKWNLENNKFTTLKKGSDAILAAAFSSAIGQHKIYVEVTCDGTCNFYDMKNDTMELLETHKNSIGNISYESATVKFIDRKVEIVLSGVDEEGNNYTATKHFFLSWEWEFYNK